MKLDIIILICAISFVTIAMIIGSYIVFTESERYVLWCVDKNGIEMSLVFRGMDRNDIDAIGQCKKMMFEPVRYYINPIYE